jgi:hypothetical protein
MNDDVLRTNLLDLLHALGDDAHRILLGGGYGLYLKQLHLAEAGVRTLIDVELWPSPRATEDLDLMLPADFVGDSRSMTSLRAVLDKLGYKVKEGAEYEQFVRTITNTQAVKIDLLTAQLGVLQDFSTIKADRRRASPVAATRPKLHAHPTDGALSLTEAPAVLEVPGKLSSGQAFAGKVMIPDPFNYLLMKLTAYRDRRDDPDKDLGRHHALDVFRIVAMLTEPEYDRVHTNLQAFTNDAQVRSCVALVRSDFASDTARGVLAMREHQLWQNNSQLPVFLETLLGLMS